MSAVEEYRKEKVYLAEVCAAGTLEDLADAAIAELEAEFVARPFPRCPNLDCKEWATLTEKNRAGWEERARKAERDALRDGLIRIVQCHNYPLVIDAVDVETGERGPHTVDGYNCADVLSIIHGVFPDFSVWDEYHGQLREGGEG